MLLVMSLTHVTMAWWCSGKVSDSRSADQGFDSRPWHCQALGQVVHTNVPLFTKQVGTLRGLSCRRAFCGSHGMKSNEQGSIVEAVL